MSTSVVIAAGGTGGHLVPGLAIAARIRALAPGALITFVGTTRGMEEELVPREGYAVRSTSVRPFGGGLRGLAAARSVPGAVRQARAILAEVGATVVIGMGGYASLPPLIAARLRRIPSIIHEANAVAGLANQLAARLTPNVAVNFPATVTSFPAGAVVTGMPLRESIATMDRAALREQARASFALASGRATVLVFGGSLGAVRINRAVAELAELWRARDDVQILVATGRGNEHLFEGLGPPLVRAVPFIERMDLGYAAGDVIVARAGASSVAEIAAAGLPSVLIPYPHARRREQDANAALLAEAGAATVLADDETDGTRLAGVLEPILKDDERRAAMGEAARSVAHLDAADQLARWALRLAGVEAS